MTFERELRLYLIVSTVLNLITFTAAMIAGLAALGVIS